MHSLVGDEVPIRKILQVGKESCPKYLTLTTGLLQFVVQEVPLEGFQAVISTLENQVWRTKGRNGSQASRTCTYEYSRSDVSDVSADVQTRMRRCLQGRWNGICT
jgi:hypothetical protein